MSKLFAKKSYNKNMSSQEQIVEAFYQRLIQKQIELSTVAGGSLLESKMGFTTYNKSTKYGYPLPTVDIKGIALLTVLPDSLAIETYGPRKESLSIKPDFHRVLEGTTLIQFTPSYEEKKVKHVFAFPFSTTAKDIQRFLVLLKEKGFASSKPKNSN